MKDNSFYQLIGDYSIHTIELYHHLIYEDYKNIFDIGICYKLSFPVSMNQGPCVFHHLRPEQSDREKP